MNFSNKTVGFALTGSFCTFHEIFPVMQRLAVEGARVVPILSQAVDATNTRFYTADRVKQIIADITSENIIRTIEDAEPIGPKGLLDVLVIAPCTGNTLGKLAHGVNDTPVTMAAKSQLRNGRPVVLSISTNDGLSASAPNIGLLMNRRNIYFVPFCQDDPVRKQTSLVAKSDLIVDSVVEALHARQIQPVIAAK